MSSIPFLENASEGENSWWRYLLTVVISLGGGTLLAGIALLVVLILYAGFLSFQGVSNITQVITSLISNPFTLIILVGVSYSLSFILFYICLRFLHHKKFLSVINTLNRLRWKLLLKGLIVWGLILFLLSLPDLILNQGSYQVTFNSKTYLLLLIICLLAFPIQASFEEILFRGYLMQGFNLFSKRLSSFLNLSSLSKPWFPLLLTSLAFGCVHFFNGTNLYMDLSIVCSTFIIGLMLGVIALGDNGIETAMGVHIANNLYIALFYNSTDSGLPGLPSVVTSEAAEPFTGLPFLILAAVITIVILFWNRKDDIVKIFR
ncbi:MAG: CAAX amino terminal protease self- immunity [Methanobacterium sp. PtaB.Bin024]|nr:MAG: CAAX amino terminal protease self- immunity [Methanobacterium sp. PtaB.Bin024]